MKITLGILSSRIRLEEKLLIREAEKREGIDLKIIDPRKIVCDPSPHLKLDALLDREISQSRAYHIMELLQNSSIKMINNFRAVRICGDKAFTSSLLKHQGVPIPKFRVAFDKRSALESAEQMGYPVVLKPVDGSWGRLLAKINDREHAEAIFEHKSHLDSHFHSVFYLQEYIEKKDRDIRAYVIGNETVGAVYRVSNHWITNAARGGRAYPVQMTDELDQICKDTTGAVGGEAVAIDLLETEDSLLVNEINCAMEFKESMKVIQADLPAKLIDLAVKLVMGGKKVGVSQWTN